ncbi:tripartite tricarboxylate transporter TctB family protein [Bradyrhizobium prioriisuperbiae]|uniref:tripartite tricarboxylate transporter TctB family protein n=1 Tax=Bradyrhizobium prioriisuperbiae TaxID=2854389 RepID=UPI0028EEDA98|nr:tripartite tricarboxylate transporter TctB family protein [Bradyrhizobium prioritasuperba]
MSKAPDRMAGVEPRGIGIRNPIGSTAVVVIAFAPQLVAIAAFLVRSILSIAPGIFGPFSISAGSTALVGFIADKNLLGLYSLPLVVIAIFTLFPRIKGPQDYYGGIVMIAVSLFALWASIDLAGQRGFSFGPGTAPRLFCGLLFLLGLAIAVTGLVTDGSPLQRFAVRGPLFVTLAIVFFAFAIRPLGLILSSILTFLIAATGSSETRWGEAIIVGVLLTLFCAFLFPYALGLPFQQLPAFLQ